MESGALPGRKPWILAVRATRLSCAWTSFSTSDAETTRSTRRSRPETISTTGCIRDLYRVIEHVNELFYRKPQRNMYIVPLLAVATRHIPHGSIKDHAEL